MNMIDKLLGAQGGAIVQQLGRQFGLDEQQASSAIGALLPSLAAGFQREASNATGLESLLGALAGGQHQRYLDDLQALGRPDTVADGNGILGHVFGSKDVSREVATRAAAQSGVGADVLKQMLPVVAALVMGALSKRQGAGAASTAGLSLPGLGGVPGQAAGGGLLDALTPLLDADRDGSVVDDVMGMIGKFMGGR
jgi:hypothetical protein